MSTALLDIHALRQTFPRADGGELLVLDGIELQLVQGQIVGLLGRTGSGKSTLLRSIAGLMPASAGSYHLSRTAGRRARARHCHGVPVLRAVSLADGAGKRPARPRSARAPRSGDQEARARRRSISSASTATNRPIRASCRAACASASALPARSSFIRISC